MASYTSGELVEVAKREIKNLTDNFDSDNYTDAAAAAIRDCGWSYPVSTDFKIKWTLERIKRHLISYLRFDSAEKFKVKQYNLQHRFTHYSQLVKTMDQEFNQAVEENPNEFANVESWRMFGTKIDAGFAYDDLGRSVTYGEDYRVLQNPDEDDS